MRARLIAAAALALALIAPARADLAAGLAAYEAEDWEAVLRELLPEAEAGNAQAQYRVAVIYLKGWSVPADTAQSLKWFEAAARGGLNTAMYVLGRLYRSGEQTPRDLDRAECWYRLAAERGDALAQFFLAELVHSILDTTDSDYWRERAIAQGQPHALYKEGSVGLLNPFVDDKTESYKLLLLAADRELPQATEKVQRIHEADLTGDRRRQFDEARRLADEWEAKPEPQIDEPLSEVPPECLGR